MAWVAEDSPMPYKAWLSVPVYASGARTRIITHLQLPVPDETAQREWILRGTALYLEE